MVYKLFNDGINDSFDRKPGPHISKSKRQLPMETESNVAKIIIAFLKLVLLIYDVFSLPIYFLLQRPDKRAYDAQRTKSERVDTNTWIKTNENVFDASHFLHKTCRRFSISNEPTSSDPPVPIKRKFLGSTMNEIFSNALAEYSSKACLGYRAVVTCPVLTKNESGEDILEDKSFRSDYTWYTYEQIGRRVQDIASGLYCYSIYPGSRAFFFSNTSLEWFIAAQACFQLNCQIVVAPEINDDLSLKLILNEAEINIIFVTCEKLTQLCKLFENVKSNSTSVGVKPLTNLKTVVIIDWQFSVDFSEPLFAQLRDSSTGIVDNMLSMGQIEEIGVENPIELSCTKYVSQELVFINEPNEITQTTKTVKNSRPLTPMVKNRYNTQLRSNLASKLRENQALVHGLQHNSSTGSTMRRRSTTSGLSTISGRGQKNRLSVLHALRDSDYTVTNEYEVKLRNISPRPLSERVASLKNITDVGVSPQPNDLGMIVYTHGSLGQIKAVMLTHNYLARCSYYPFLDGLVDETDVHCTTLALDNVIEFMTEMCLFCHGGSIGYSCGSNTLFYDGKDLFKRDLSDLQALNPTFLLVRPYILERLRSSVENYMRLALSPFKSFVIANALYEYKKKWARRHFETPIVDSIFCLELRRLFGKRIKYILCNGATDCTETKDFFAFILNIPVIELYSPDEAVVSLISVNDIWDYKRRINKNKPKRYSNFIEDEADEEIDDFQNMQLMPPRVNKNTFKEDTFKNLLITSSILCPSLETRIRLEDWEDFRTSDQPYPRGRLIIGGDVVCKGYFKRPIATKEAFFVDDNQITWFRTNDITRVFPNGSFEIISAMTDIIKMEDGQFISLSQIEHILRNSQFVENVCAICGDDRKFVIALVVPNLLCLALKSPEKANLKMAIGTDPDPEELLDVEFRREVCSDRLLSEFVDKHLGELITQAGFQSIPSRFYLVPEIWTPDTELVTPSFEPKRNAIQKYYATDIQSIFKMNFNHCRNRLSARSNRPRKYSNPL